MKSSVGSDGVPFRLTTTVPFVAPVEIVIVSGISPPQLSLSNTRIEVVASSGTFKLSATASGWSLTEATVINTSAVSQSPCKSQST